jgi:hypothetical protein
MRIAGITKRLLLVVLWSVSAMVLKATTIFDNTVTPSRAIFQNGGIEIGDEIQLAGTERYLTSFSFVYGRVGAHPEAHVDARVRFYLNDGPPPLFDSYAAPGTCFFDSDWFPVVQAFRGTLVFSAGSEFPAEGLFLPSSNMTWSLQFQGLPSGEAGGVEIYSPPVVGTDPPYFWSNQDGDWYRQSGGSPVDFGAKMEAVPEPSTPTLLIAGTVLLAAGGIWRRRVHET